MTTNTNRIIWIDYVKAFAIMIVIMLHIGIPDPFRTIVRSFIIPIFFILSGLFYTPNKYTTYNAFWEHKTLRLLVPYLILNAITYIYWLLIARNLGADAETTIPFWKPLLGIILGLEHWMEHCKPLWFLPCLMLTEWIFYLLHRMSKKNEKILLGYVTLTTLLGFLLSQFNTPPLPWGIGGSCSMMLFYFIGYILRIKNYFDILQKTNQHYYSTTFWGSICLISIVFCTYLSLQTSETKVFENSYGNLFYSIPAAICGSMFLITLGMIVHKLFPLSKVLEYIGQHTLPILAMHLIVAGWIKGFTYFILDLPLIIYSELWIQLVFVFAIIWLSLPVCYLYDKSKQVLVNL